MQLKWTSKALSDLARLYDFLAPVNKRAAARTVQSLMAAPARLLEQPRLGEKLHVLRVGARPAALDVVHTEGIQFLRDPKLVGHGKIDAFGLRSVAQGRVIDCNGLFH